MDFSLMDALAIFLATFAAFAFGAIWYGPLFSKMWQKEVGLSDKDLKEVNMGVTFGGAFVLFGVAASFLWAFIGPDADMTMGSLWGAMAGIGFVSMFIGINYIYEMKSIKLYFINATYAIIALTIMGLVLGGFNQFV